MRFDKAWPLGSEDLFDARSGQLDRRLHGLCVLAGGASSVRVAISVATLELTHLLESIRATASSAFVLCA